MTETYVRTQIEVQVATTDAPADLVVHSVWHHHTTIGGIAGPFDPAGHATNVMNAFVHGTGAGTHQFVQYAGRNLTTKVYDMMAMKPRPVIGTATHTPSSPDSTEHAPRELAIPLRYYADRNLVGQRGRLYIGPFMLGDVHELVTALLALQILDLATALAAIGGANMSWCMHSEKQDVLNAPASPGGTTVAAWHDITHAWVNDQWAHMESREHVEAFRWNQSITPGIP